MEQRLKYFAFGSNMHLIRMRDRVPSCEFVGIGTLLNFSLRFHKRSPDGSGKCSIIEEPGNLQPVLGVIYTMKESEKEHLDFFEGVGHGYEVKQLEVLQDRTVTHSVFTYCAQKAWIDNELLPYDWYKSLVLQGAEYFNFPAHYIASLRKQKMTLDTDSVRSVAHQKILNRL